MFFQRCIYNGHIFVTLPLHKRYTFYVMVKSFECILLRDNVHLGHK